MTDQLNLKPSISKPWKKFYADSMNVPLPEATIYEYLWERNKERLSDTALNYFDRKISYGEVFENINSAAKAYLAMGVKQGDIVIVSAVTIPETIYTFYALNLIGAVPNMVDPRTSDSGIREYIREVDCRFIVVLDVFAEKLLRVSEGSSVEKLMVISPKDSLPGFKKTLFSISQKLKKEEGPKSHSCIYWPEFIKKGSGTELIKAPYKKDSCCAIVHTGGTTGMPKCVMLTNDNLNGSALQCMVCGLDFKPRHRWLAIMPPFIAYGIGNGLHLPLCSGMELDLVPKFDPDKYDELLLKFKPNHIAGAPSHYYSLLHSKKMQNADLSFLRSPIVGGDTAEPHFEAEVSDFLRAHNCPTNLVKGYGMTELSAAATITGCPECNKNGSVGIPLPLTTISIFEPGTENELDIGQEGEICITGPNVMLGYYGLPEETANILRRHGDGKVWVHSGDVGRMDSDGCLYIEGRIKRVVIRFDGFKVFPIQIEMAVASHSSVEECCVVGKKDTEHSQGQVPVAYAVLKPEYQGHEKEYREKIMRSCEQQLPEYEMPSDIIFLPKLPKTDIGKLDYRSLEML